MEIMVHNNVPFSGWLLSNNTEVYSGFQNIDSLVYIVKGGLRYFNDEEEFISTAGELFFSAKYADYKVQRILDPETNDFESIVVAFQDGLDCTQEFNNTVDLKLNFKIDSDTLKELFVDIRDCYYTKTYYTDHEIEQLLKKVNHLLCEEANNELAALRDHRNDKLLEFLYKHITKNITLEELANNYGTSLSSFQRLFKRKLGVSPHKWIKDQRLHHSRFQMQYTQKPISQIYLDLGYEDLAHFSKEFKKKFGYNPSDTYNTVEIEVVNI